MKVAIGLPNTGMMHTDCAMSLCRLVPYSMANGIQVAIIDQRTSMIEKGRHEIVEHAIKGNFDKILFVDSDMVFPADTLMRLLSHDREIVGCNYAKRRRPITPTARRESMAVIKPGKSDLESIGFLATGCLLVDVAVFLKLGEPYFSVEWRGDDFMGEDYLFCEQARKAGYEVWLDHKLSREIGHIGDITYMLGDCE